MVGLMSMLFALSLDISKIFKYSYSEMSCHDAQNIIDRVYEYNQKSEFINREDADEIVQVIKESTPECFNEGSEPNP